METASSGMLTAEHLGHQGSSLGDVVEALEKDTYDPIISYTHLLGVLSLLFPTTAMPLEGVFQGSLTPLSAVLAAYYDRVNDREYD